MTSPPVSAAVLIGGRSRRMGTPKALIRFGPDGETLIERTVSTLRRVAPDPVLVGTPDWPVPPSIRGVPVVADRGASAADGVIAALESSACRFCLIVACDMPFLDPGLLREMAVTATRAGQGVIAVNRRGRHPLHAVWDRDRLSDLVEGVERGERALAALAHLAGMAAVVIDAPGREDRERWSVFNVNTPDDLDFARAHARGDR